MNISYILEPEVPGGFGNRTIINSNTHPPKILKIHFIFDGWLGDQIIECFPCYLVSSELAEILVKHGVSGFVLEDVEIEKSETFLELYPERKVPPFKWFKVTGLEENCDVYINSENRLTVNKKVLEIILSTKPTALEVYKMNQT